MCQTSVGQHDHELVEIAVVIEFLPKKAARLDKTQHSERLRDIEILLTNDAQPVRDVLLRRDIHVRVFFAFKVDCKADMPCLRLCYDGLLTRPCSQAIHPLTAKHSRLTTRFHLFRVILADLAKNPRRTHNLWDCA